MEQVVGAQPAELDGIIDSGQGMPGSRYPDTITPRPLKCTFALMAGWMRG